ncbi:hypothetical protein [Nocardia abscessus]|uniref:hypothetical protein n=1 Tax=Nocardia abscessus TaxID=120957 RepID=UPI002453D86C|nr:hypothetical protein [Nocardia abscessus]
MTAREMATRTYIEVARGKFVNADMVTSIETQQGTIFISDGKHSQGFQPEAIPREGAAVHYMVELMRELGRPATEPGLRIITLLQGQIVSRYLQ